MGAINIFSSKTAHTQQKLAEILLSCKIGDKIPTFSFLHDELKVGTGTIQSALKDFEQEEIIKLKAQPHYGTILISKDIKKLWGFLPNRHLVGLFPEPLSLEMRGLAMGIREALNDLNIPLVIVYGYGSAIRFDRILSKKSKEDFVVSSLASAKDRKVISPKLKIALKFNSYTFYKKDGLLLLEKQGIENRLVSNIRVGLDDSSYDQSILTKEIYPNAEYIPVKYSNVPFEILNQNIDCAVWHRTQNEKYLQKTSIDSIKIQQNFLKNVSLEEISKAVISVNSDNCLIIELLRNINVEKIQYFQKQVVEGKIDALF